MPRKISDRMVDAILDAIASGAPTHRACKEQGIDPRVFYTRMNREQSIGERYARAKMAGLDALADETVQLADTPIRGVKTTTKADGTTETVEGDAVDRSRLQVDTRKWLLAKLAPKKYGERTVVAGDPEAPLGGPIVVPGIVTPEEWAKQVKGK